LIDWLIVEIGSCYSEENNSSEYKDYNGGEYRYTVRSHIEKSEIIREISGLLSHYVCHHYLTESGSQLLHGTPSLVMLRSINFDSVLEQKMPPLDLAE